MDKNFEIKSLEPRDWTQETIEEHLTCLLCGSELRFKHAVDHILQQVKEEAYCPCCNVRSRQAAHTLQ